MLNRLLIPSLLSLVLSGLFMVSGCTTRNTTNQPQPTPAAQYAAADLKRGAQLYDKWYKLTGTAPEGTHAAYPKTSKKIGSNTFRCKECHGWDYIGDRGRYRKGSHYTGIVGVKQVTGQSPQALYTRISGLQAGHQFNQLIGEQEIWHLVKFIKEGLYDINQAIDANGNGRGDQARGKALYTQYCGECHQANGQEYDFKLKKEGVQGVGYLARKNPQESMHKYLWGHPGSDMPSLLVDNKKKRSDAVDILTYAQTLAQ